MENRLTCYLALPFRVRFPSLSIYVCLDSRTLIWTRGKMYRLILILYFCIPRTPTITFRHQKVPSTVFTSTDETPFITSTDPVSYSFRGNLIFARTFLLFCSLHLSNFADSKSSHFGCMLQSTHHLLTYRLNILRLEFQSS